MGVVERAGCYLYSTMLFFDSLGKCLGQHRKLIQTASESSALWRSGEKSTLPTYETSIGKIGGLICWDNRLPLLRTELYDKGTPRLLVTLKVLLLFSIGASISFCVTKLTNCVLYFATQSFFYAFSLPIGALRSFIKSVLYHKYRCGNILCTYS